MKQIMKIAGAALLAASLTVSAAGAEWTEGRSPSQPYKGVPEVDLSETMGYIMLYPRSKMPAEHFADALEIFLPREDVELSDGVIHLYDEEGEIFSTSFADSAYVAIREFDEDELDGLMWGGGRCIDVRLPVSLTIGASYYVTMEEGCFTAADGSVKSLGYTGREIWVPLVNGEYGVSALRYSSRPEEGGSSSAVSASEAAPENSSGETVSGAVTMQPKVGDEVDFELLMGGDAVTAVTFSENGSVLFDELEYSESGAVHGRVTGDEVSWGIVFMNDGGDVLNILNFTK